MSTERKPLPENLPEIWWTEAAIPALKSLTDGDPEHSEAWLALHYDLTTSGRLDEARHAYGQFLRSRSPAGPVRRAAEQLCEGRLPEADFLLKDHRRRNPPDPLVLQLAAETAFRRQKDADSIALLNECLQLAPDQPGARFSRALAYYRSGKPVEAEADLESELQRQPDNPACRALLAAALTKTTGVERALELYSRLTNEFPSQATLWMSFGHVLKAAGRQPESIEAYRKATQLEPKIGEAWWSLANLKTVKLSADDIRAMTAQLDRSDLTDDDRLHFEFSLGKAHEDLAQFDTSFRHYDAGNRLRLRMAPYDAESSTVNLRRSQSTYTRDFFDERRDCGAKALDPIFIVGLPRAGSTLIEQILASHSLIEGTMELPNITDIARSIADRQRNDSDYDYLPLVPSLEPDEWRALGERYISGTRIYRKSSRPFFIDKMPNNFTHLGLIHLILPNARIIDARRHPMASCFSNFKQHFALGQLFSYGLENIGRFYRDYVELMAHFDAVLPGRVHRVYYENMVSDTENEIRRLLDYCGVPFEEQCLRFHETERIVRTASSEQVRKPIYREGVDHWRHYEPWLAPLKDALGAVLTSYPAVPVFDSPSNR